MTSELINIVKRKYCGCMGDYVVIVPINHPWVNGKKSWNIEVDQLRYRE